MTHKETQQLADQLLVTLKGEEEEEEEKKKKKKKKKKKP